MRKILFLCLCLLFLTHNATTDFGDFAGDSDYGGWDSGWSSSSSSGGGGGGWDGGGWDSGGSRGGGSMSAGAAALFICCILAIIPLSIAARIAEEKWGDHSSEDWEPQRSNEYPPGAKPSDRLMFRSVGAFKEVDPGFSEEAFKRRLSDIYLELQRAWQTKDLEPVRPYLTNTLFQQYDLQLNNYRRTGTTNVMEQVAVLGITLIGWVQQGNEDVIIARLQARLIDYVVNDATGQLVRGSRTAEKYMTYEYSMSRRAGVKTASTDGMQTVNCPNCGSVLDVNQSAVCPYCGSIIQTSPMDWTISGIKGLSQRTVEK